MEKRKSADIQTLSLQFRQAVGDLVFEAANDSAGITDPLSVVNSTKNILFHGFISGGSLFSRGRTVWDFIEGTLNSPDVIETVNTLTEHAEDQKVDCWIKMALLQQKLSAHLSCLCKNPEILKTWYEPWAMLNDQNVIWEIIEVSKGLDKLNLNIDMKEKKRRSISLNLASFGSVDGVLAGLNQTINTIGSVPNQVIGKAKSGMGMLASPKDAEEYLQLQSLVKELKQENLRLQLNLSEEQLGRQEAETDLMKLKISRDRQVQRFGEEISRLESILRENNVNFTSNLASLV